MTSFVLVKQILDGYNLHKPLANKFVNTLFAHDILVGWIITFDVDVALDEFGRIPSTACNNGLDNLVKGVRSAHFQ